MIFMRKSLLVCRFSLKTNPLIIVLTVARKVGSPGYMAPELMMRPANEKTDAFALGVVL